MRVANQHLIWRPYDQAKEYARSLGLTSSKEWTKYCKGLYRHLPTKPDDIPRAPHVGPYRDEWRGGGGWFGTGKLGASAINWMSFKEAREFVHSLNLRSKSEWSSYCRGDIRIESKRPQTIPVNPVSAYKEHWIGWGDWLGTGTVATFNLVWMPFEQARDFARRLGLKSEK